jgi:hypothetical protein
VQQQQLQGFKSIAAVMENRAQEVGIALLTPDLHEITLTQTVDNSLYTHTQAFL